MKYGYKEIRKISVENLMRLCIREKLYTRGNNEEYGNMLFTAAGHENITTDNIVEIVTDIIEHSETDYEYTSLMYMVEKECNTYFEEI